jgi:hypothetical protein
VFTRSGYRLDTGDLGFVLSAKGLGVAVSEAPRGLVTDRPGERKVRLTGLGLTGAVLALMAPFVSPVAWSGSFRTPSSSDSSGPRPCKNVVKIGGCRHCYVPAFSTPESDGRD